MKKRIPLLLLVLILVLSMSLQTFAEYGYSNPGDTDHFVYYKGVYDAATYPQQSLEAQFTTDTITVDGLMDDAYGCAPSSAIGNIKELSNLQYALTPTVNKTNGVLRSVWDGPVLYLFVEVNDESPMFGAAPPANGGAMTSKPAVPTDRDSVAFAFDLYNEKVVYETDTAAAFTIDSTGNLYFYRSGIPSLGSVFADPTHPEYSPRIKSYVATPTATGYNVELALQIEGTALTNGTTFGVDVELCNVETLAAHTEKVPNPWYPWWGPEFNVTDYPEGPGRSSNTFWSHQQDTLYAEFDHERPNSADWGNVTLSGWDGTASFALSTWRLTSNISYLESIRFPKEVYTAESQQALDAAVASAKALIDSSSTDLIAVNDAADALEAAIKGLRWADTKYPDPDALQDQFTLPNVYQFFGSSRLVQNNADWAERRAEILDLAQFYEYGYKPAAPDAMTITGITAGVSGSNPKYTIATSITYGSLSKSLSFSLYMPTDAQLASNGHSANIPVVLSFDGNIASYLNAGIAVLSVPSVTGGDSRTNAYAWGTRTGVFYDFFPYSRNGAGALKEVSSEMAAAWGASRAIDALELMGVYTTPVGGKDVTTLINPANLAVTGFSINGKYAFVSAVFDDRIDVCIPGAAGATGPSPWRYVYAGQQYDWSSTVYAPNGAAQQTAFGTEFMANSVRHNRVRETELFRQFLNFGHFYEKVDGAYGYGTRLPFDQNDLVATLAPRAIVLENTLNDYNDGCVADALSLDIAKSVYANLGYDAESLVKYNFRPVQPTGDPHGNDTVQRSRSAEYLNNFFYGTAMLPETSTWLATNPFTLPVSNDRTESPYDYYYGGYNTITGGTGGVGGTDGWYNYLMPSGFTIQQPTAIETYTFHAPILPAQVTVFYNDGTSGEKSVVWDTVPPEQYASSGSFTVSGTVEGTFRKAQQEVTVVAGTSVKVQVPYSRWMGVSTPVVRSGDIFDANIAIGSYIEDLYAVDVTVTYDSALIEYLPNENLEALSADPANIFILGADSSEPGKVRLLVGSTNALLGQNIQIAKLQFKAKEVMVPTPTLFDVGDVAFGVGSTGAVGDAPEITNQPIIIRKAIAIGDVNEDGRVTIGDLAAIIHKYMMKAGDVGWQAGVGNELPGVLCDITGILAGIPDGVVDILDMAQVARILMGK